jgi:hypothetical protein
MLLPSTDVITLTYLPAHDPDAIELFQFSPPVPDAVPDLLDHDDVSVTSYVPYIDSLVDCCLDAHCCLNALHMEHGT